MRFSETWTLSFLYRAYRNAGGPNRSLHGLEKQVGHFGSLARVSFIIIMIYKSENLG